MPSEWGFYENRPWNGSEDGAVEGLGWDGFVGAAAMPKRSSIPSSG